MTLFIQQIQCGGKIPQVTFRAKIAAPIHAVPTYYKTIWGDHFLTYSSSDPLLAKDDMIRHEKLKEEVRDMLTGCTDVSETIETVDAVQRLGVDYHFRPEIDQILATIMDETRSILFGDEDDLHAVSLKFRVLRQHRYDISCDVFDKFKDGNGKFIDTIIKDARGMLSLYEATYLRTHGEKILDEALCFTTEHLKMMAAELDSPLSNKINNALNQPYCTGIPRVETWKYIHCFKVNDSRDDALLNFAKLDYNLLQKQHQKEVGELTSWWKELDFGKQLPFVRDRLVQCYFWALGFYFEPEFRPERMMLIKLITAISVIDDICDEVAPFPELELFTHAIERWDLSEMKKLPDYMKGIYKATIDAYSEIEDKMAKKGKSYRAHYGRESMKLFVRGNLTQANWVHKKHMPTMDEFLFYIVPSMGWDLFALSSILVMDDDIVTKEICAWLFSQPNIVKAVNVFTVYVN